MAHGIYVNSYPTNVGYRNNATKGLATGDPPEAMYMVIDGNRYSDHLLLRLWQRRDRREGRRQRHHGGDVLGVRHQWTRGGGNGPWIAADLENGMFKSNQGGWQTTSTSPNDNSVIAPFATAMLKGPSGNHFTLKAGNAQSGALTNVGRGASLAWLQSQKKLQAAIVLGTGGDGSNDGTGTFFEGAITSGNPPDATDARAGQHRRGGLWALRPFSWRRSRARSGCRAPPVRKMS